MAEEKDLKAQSAEAKGGANKMDAEEKKKALNKRTSLHKFKLWAVI